MQVFNRLIDHNDFGLHSRRRQESRDLRRMLRLREASIEPFQRIVFDRIYKIYRILGVWGRVPR